MAELLINRIEYFQHIDTNNDHYVLGMDYNHKGLIKENPGVEAGGRKKDQLFSAPIAVLDDPADFAEAVRITFTDIVEGGILTSVSALVEVCNDDGTVEYSKTEIQKINNLEKFMIARYNRAYTYLRNSSKGTPIEGLINAILEHYQSEISAWLLGDPQKFIDAKNNETDPTIVAYLETVIDGASKTVNDALTEQLTGIKYVA